MRAAGTGGRPKMRNSPDAPHPAGGGVWRRHRPAVREGPAVIEIENHARMHTDRLMREADRHRLARAATRARRAARHTGRREHHGFHRPGDRT